MMEKHELDEDARSKLREICEKRAEEMAEVLAEVEALVQGWESVFLDNAYNT